MRTGEGEKAGLCFELLLQYFLDLHNPRVKNECSDNVKKKYFFFHNIFQTINSIR